MFIPAMPGIGLRRWGHDRWKSLDPTPRVSSDAHTARSGENVYRDSPDKYIIRFCSMLFAESGPRYWFMSRNDWILWKNFLLIKQCCLILELFKGLPSFKKNLQSSTSESAFWANGALPISESKTGSESDDSIEKGSIWNTEQKWMILVLVIVT